MDIGEPYMTKEEKDLILFYMAKYKPKKILEYGIGWSTAHFSKHEFIEQYYGIEHNADWIAKVNGIVDQNKVKFIHCPINYKDYQNQELLTKYVNHQSIGPFDFIFIDGDHRHQCLEFAAKNLTPNGFCMVHDSSRKDMHSYFKHFKNFRILTPGEINSHNDWHQGLTVLWNFEGTI